jgi:SAM-dependent methyltransferase
MTANTPAGPPRAFTDERAALGNPSFVWRSGQTRRLALVRQFVPLQDRRILDVGCGVGTYVHAFRDYSAEVYGVDIAAKRVRRGAQQEPNLLLASSDSLPFCDASFDVVFMNEVIEHVRDDRATMAELARVLRPGGHAVLYAPNRLYPFETHGIYLGSRYVFGNVPLVNYLPHVLRDRLVPHARVYSTRDFRRLSAGLPFSEVVHTYVYPGFDNIAARSALLARALRRLLYAAEHTRIRVFGLSHLVIFQRVNVK